MNPIVKNNFYIITGGPGAGKTSVLDNLENSGYDTVAEVGRKIIKEQLATAGNATHAGDRIAFRDLMFKYSLEDFNKFIDAKKIMFFDRGIPEILSYSKLISAPVSETILDAIKNYRYNTNVFIFPPWEAIYSNDEERKQDFQEAIMTHQYITEAYTTAGYQLIEVPKIDIQARTKFILNYITDLTKDHADVERK